MKRRPLIFIAAFILLLAIIISILFWPNPQPRYQGKPLGYWVNGFGHQRPASSIKSAEAIRQIGPAGVPFLVQQLTNADDHPEPPWREKIREQLEEHSIALLRSPADSERFQALAALDALGPTASNSIPILEDILFHQPSEATHTLVVLARIGTPAIPVLQRAATNQDRLIRAAATICLNMIRTNSPILFPKTDEENDYNQRICALNLMLMAQFWQNNASNSQLKIWIEPMFTPPNTAH